MAKILFVTGTDTGVGKTLVTASLLYALRKRGTRALAMKPFCSGSRNDVHLLQTVQQNEITDDEANPFYFPLPITPLLGARKAKRTISEKQVIECISRVAGRCDLLLVEGAGGLLSPLGERFNAADLISRLGCDVCVVAANKLGVLNHTLLTVGALQRLGSVTIKVVLSQSRRVGDASTVSNASLLGELLKPVPVFVLPYLGTRASTYSAVERNHARLKRVAGDILQ